VKGWDAGKGVLSVCIHGLKGADGKTSSKGENPFEHITHGVTGKKLSLIVKVYDPPYTSSTDVYDYIKKNLESWIEKAIEIRGAN
jgi:hypothetical protein